jgi:DNA-directed RNA polymerase specialized sigma24 family protein
VKGGAAPSRENTTMTPLDASRTGTRGPRSGSACPSAGSTSAVAGSGSVVAGSGSVAVGSGSVAAGFGSSATGSAEAARWSQLLAQARLAAARVLRLPPGHPDVEDRAQDALLAFLCSGQARFDPRQGTLAAYVATIAKNLALSHLRDRSTRTRLDARFAEERRTDAGCDAPLRQVEAVRDLSRVLSRLCPGHVEALRRIDLRGEGIGEAAARLGKTYQAMNGQVGHARAAARRVARELLAA